MEFCILGLVDFIDRTKRLLSMIISIRILVVIGESDDQNRPIPIDDPLADKLFCIYSKLQSDVPQSKLSNWF
jgi:hypothetical protein